ncbi:MAG: hypothetical protein RJA49_1033 [Actinomycetota bacterium]
MSRRVPALVLFVLAPLALLALFPLGVAKTLPPTATPTFAALGEPTMPFVPRASFINSTWFCGGVPNVAKATGGSVTVANPTDAPLSGQLTVFSDVEGVTATETPFQVPPRGTFRQVLSGVQAKGSYLSAMVEIAGGGGFVEQQAASDAGNAVSPCSNSTSSNWYFADNYTLSGSTEDLVITNPFPDDAILNLTFASNDGTRRPPALQGLPVRGNSIIVISQDKLAKDEAVLAVTINASRGRVVAARAQHYKGERSGFSLSLGSPSVSSEWWFADGEAGKDVTFERYSIYNPTDQDVSVTTNFWGLQDHPEFIGVRTDTVPAGNVISFTTKEFDGLPDGRHGMTFSTESDAAIVVERGITRRAGDGFATSVVFGAPQVFSGYTRWSMAIGPDVAADNVLAIMNLDFLDGTVTVKALGPGGEVPIPGLEKVALPKSGVIDITIPDEAAALGVPLIVESTQRIVVERKLPRGAGLSGRSGSLAMPG